jgi:trk system potassium uptake protein TrkA
MKIIIVGAGQVGYHLAETRSQEDQGVVVIDSNPERAEHIGDRLDVLSVAGNGASIRVLETAGVADAKLFLAVTNKDEVNIIGCLAAHRLGVEQKVARISSPEFYVEGSVLSHEHLGIDLMINPERESARETFELLSTEAATELVSFAKGKVFLIGMRVLPDAPVVGKSIAQLDEELHPRAYTTVAINRDGETEIPNGSSRIEADDLIFLVSPAHQMAGLPALAGYEPYRLRRVMIAGGSQEAVYLARTLTEHDIAYSILDIDRARCVELSSMLPEALVLQGDATDAELLDMEGIAGVDGFVAYTGQDETNMLSSLLAKASGARKVVSLLHRRQYIPLANKVGIDAAVSPRLSAANSILRYLHRANVLGVVALRGIDAEAIEVRIGSDATALGRPFRSLDIPEGGVVGAIIRGRKVITPRGDDAVRAGDHVVLFALPHTMPKLERLFA